MGFHVEDGGLDIVDVAAAVEESELALVFGLWDLIEGELVKVFKEPGPGVAVGCFGAEDVFDGGGCEVSVLCFLLKERMRKTAYMGIESGFGNCKIFSRISCSRSC